MRTRPTWWFVMVGIFLAFNLFQAVRYGGRWPWIAVAVLALLLASRSAPHQPDHKMYRANRLSG